MANEPLKEPGAHEEVAVLKTNLGRIVLRFFDDKAPKHVENFKKLAKEGFYDGTKFHRVIPGFMIQGGDPNSRGDNRAIHGTGGPGYGVKAEFNDTKHDRGILSAARSSDPDSAGSQFFIVHGDAKFLDGQYTAFGALTSGEDVLEKLAGVPTKGPEKSTPVERVAIESIKIV